MTAKLDLFDAVPALMKNWTATSVAIASSLTLIVRVEIFDSEGDWGRLLAMFDAHAVKEEAT
jgi:hypothetical protein